ncbi:MAG TPA: VIT domain-containing protein [Tepidisphaeraceae bacterium]|jgi:Ca-activated chloride channel family protein
MPRFCCALIACVSFLFGITATAHGDGLIVIHNPPTRIPGHFSFAPLEVAYHNVTVSIDQNVAVTAVDQEFYNPNPQRLEGTYIFPLPDGATIDRFSMDIDGKMMDAELLSADKAKVIYEEIVRKQRDPALLEYLGRGAFKVRIFPIEPNSRKHIKLRYTQLIKSDSGLSEYVYPLNTEKFSARPLHNVSVKVELKTSTPIKNVYCPSHAVEIRRDGASRAVIGYEDHNVRPDTDFKLIWSQDKDPVGLNLLSWQTGTGDGYFLLMASPGMNVDPKKVQPRDICFVLDTSGSMAGAKMEQAKKALQFCLANLNPEDRFEVVRFSTESESLFGSLNGATPDNIAKAGAFVKDLKAIGGTAIQDALNKASQLFSNADQKQGRSQSRPGVIIFLTDGQPTVGETNEDRLVESIATRSTAVRIFSFGIGTDVNTHLLDRIAEKTNAFSQYVLPEEDIELKLSSFYTKIKEPVLSNVELAFTGEVKVNQLYPHDLPDLFKGETLTVFGRYSGGGAGAVKVTGTLNGERREFVSDVKFVKEDVSRGFIPRLWATRRVGWLLDEIRLRGESMELKDEIVRLAREHGIVTPYTSYLILEDERRRNVPLSLQTMRELGSDRLASAQAKETYDSARRDSAQLERAGRRALANSANAQSLKQADSESQAQQGYALGKTQAAGGGGGGFGGGGRGGGGGGLGGRPYSAAAAAPQPEGYRAAQNYAQQSRVVKGRAFYQNGNIWTDAQAQNAQNLKRATVVFNSEPYYELLSKHPEATAWLSLGDEVDVVLDDTIYSIRNEASPSNP